MESEPKNSEKANKFYWQTSIALLVIILIVLAGSIFIILIQGGHKISGREVASGVSFPLIIFIPIWAAILKQKEKPSLKQKKIIKKMGILALILLLVNIFLFLMY